MLVKICTLSEKKIIRVITEHDYKLTNKGRANDVFEHFKCTRKDKIPRNEQRELCGMK